MFGRTEGVRPRFGGDGKCLCSSHQNLGNITFPRWSALGDSRVTPETCTAVVSRDEDLLPRSAVRDSAGAPEVLPEAEIKRTGPRRLETSAAVARILFPFRVCVCVYACLCVCMHVCVFRAAGVA